MCLYSKEFNYIKPWTDFLPSMKELLDEIEANVRGITPEALILPSFDMIFNAFKYTSFDDVSVVIIGQDPYHQICDVDGAIINQAMGLSFSVPRGLKVPPSLKNIYKELENNFVDFISPSHGDLTTWANQVLLLNTSLTVEWNKPASHAKTGWHKFTSKVIEALVQREKPIVFLSWGRHAHKITECAENTHHCVIKTSHPSPLGARKSGVGFDAFLGSQCFVRANQFLSNNGMSAINWSSICFE